MTNRAHWSGRLAFVLAAAGSAVGLGNMWKFPYITGTNGGGAFVLIYLLCIAVVGIPIFIAELYIGQQGQKNAVEAFEVVHKNRTPWRGIGAVGILSAVLILSFYSVVGGWVLDFEFRSIIGEFMMESDDKIKATLGSLFENSHRQLFWHLIFMGLAVGVVIGGVKNGLERWNKILMPALITILVGLFFYSTSLDGFGRSMGFLFSFNWENLTAAGVLEAVGHAFFTLSLGMGAIITYGSYLQKRTELARTAMMVAFLDTAIALIAGAVIFSIVFTYGFEAGSGPSLMFETLPMLFVKLTGGFWVSIVFFLLVAVAALTSAVSLLEVIVAYWEEKHNMKRWKATLLWGLIIWAVGVLCVLSISGDSPGGIDFFGIFDMLTSQYFLPIGGLLISLFFGWVLGPRAVEHVVGKEAQWAAQGLLWTSRVLAPLAVAIAVGNKIINS